jgi:hypothetical protein
MSWWKRYRPLSSPPLRGPGADDHPDPNLAQGALVRLKGKPDRIRRVLRAEWHSFRHAYVYIVETSAAMRKYAHTPFPYWFADQLELVGPADEINHPEGVGQHSPGRSPG